MSPQFHQGWNRPHSYGGRSAAEVTLSAAALDVVGRLSVEMEFPATAPLLFVTFGLTGTDGLLISDIKNRVCLDALMRGIFLASAFSLALLALTPGDGWAVLASAPIQGSIVMTASAAFSFWSARHLPQIPSVSITAVLSGVALGSVLGTGLAG